MSDRAFSLPRLGGNSAVVLFIVTLVAFVVESQLTQVSLLFCLSVSPLTSLSIKHVQSTLNFRKPFLLL